MEFVFDFSDRGGVTAYVSQFDRTTSFHHNPCCSWEPLETIRKYNPATHVIMLSSQEKYSTALKSIQKGAEQYVIKDENAFQKILDLINEM